MITSTDQWSSPLTREDLETLAGHCRIFVDTCSLMSPSAEVFFYNGFPPALLTMNARLIIPSGVLQEVKKHQNTAKTKDAATKAEKIVANYLEQKIAELRGEKNDPFVDSLFLTLFQKFRTEANLALITQDKALAEEIQRLNTSRAVRSKYQIYVFRIYRGNLLPFNGKSQVEISQNPNPTRHGKPGNSPKQPSRKRDQVQQKDHTQLPPRKPLFQHVSRIISQNDEVISVRTLPEEGFTVTDCSDREIGLAAPLAQGGEGTIYLTSDADLVAKIYKRERITKSRLRKLELMVEKQISAPGICWPETILFNEFKQFVGYVMPRGRGTPIQQRLFIRPIFHRTYPLWDRSNLLRFSISVLEKIKILNENNVIIGDINPNNILTDGEDSYFVDCDSYQVEGFPCPVGTINYTAPEIQRKDFSTFLRSQEHENYAAATLVFMLMLPGKPPYSHQGGGDPLENIMKREFSYPLKNKSNKKTPEGPWRYIWSNLPFKLKDALYQCFRDGVRPSVGDWLNHLDNYLYLITKNPPAVVPTLFPTHLKPITQYAREKFGVEE